MPSGVAVGEANDPASCVGRHVGLALPNGVYHHLLKPNCPRLTEGLQLAIMVRCRVVDPAAVVGPSSSHGTARSLMKPTMLHEGETQRFFMTRRFSAPLLSLLIALVMLGVTSSPVLTSFNDNPAVMTTEGRQETLDVDCSGYT